MTDMIDDIEEREEEATEQELTAPEIRRVVRLRDQIQKARIGCSNRIWSIKNKRAEGDIDFWELMLGRVKPWEEETNAYLRNIVEGYAVWSRWGKYVKGMGLISLGIIIGEIDIRKAHSISALWRFSGYGVINGERQRRLPAEKSDYNGRLRTMIYRQAQGLLRAGGCYADLYQRFKEEEIRRAQERGLKIVPSKKGKALKDDEMAALHVHLRALRRMIKIWLSHLWLVWREAEGLPLSKPYAIDRLGHADFIGIMTDEEVAAKKSA